MNKDLLYTLYAIHSPSGRERKMRKFLKRVAREYCGATDIVQDNIGNLLITKGESDTYPCVAAHIDQVQENHSKDFRVVEIDGDAVGYSIKSHSQQGLGADDKNGIFICLEMLRKYDAIKVAFFVGEETGCVGSSAVDLSFFADCRYIIEPDRMGKSDLITSMFCGAVCSNDFIEAIGYESYGYKIKQGSVTDVGTLVERGVGISCLNLSCGYYDAHTDNEICVLSELENCLDFVSHIIDTLGDVYPYEYNDTYYNYYTGKRKNKYSNYNWQDDYYGYYEEDYYYSSGYYDEDYNTIKEIIEVLGVSDFNSMLAQYRDYFRVFDVVRNKNNAEDLLKDLYTNIVKYYNDDKKAI